MNIIQCIYCLQNKSESCFKKREHVIPQCFGRFSPDNLVLRRYVCDECNQFFGDKIELFWGRDSLESIERLIQGIKSKNSLKKRIRIKGKIPDGDFKGVLVREVGISESGNILGENLVQAGFYHKTKSEYHYFEIGDIPFLNELIEQGYEIKNRMIWLIGDKDEINLLENELKEKGIPLKNESKLVKEIGCGEKIPIDFEATLDRVIMRGICKLAFNYLAYIAGKPFVLNSNFSGIRQFIRYDKGESDKYLSVNQPPILHDDQLIDKYGIKVTKGHLITIEWNGNRMISKVSLFNFHTYGVNLCEDYDGLWIPLSSGHHFDTETMELSKLLVVSKKLIP